MDHISELAIVLLYVYFTEPSYLNLLLYTSRVTKSKFFGNFPLSFYSGFVIKSALKKKRVLLNVGILFIL